MELVACYACQSLRRVAARCPSRKLSNSNSQGLQSCQKSSKSYVFSNRTHLPAVPDMRHRPVLSQVHLHNSLLLINSIETLSWCQYRYLRTLPVDDWEAWAQSSRQIERLLERHGIPYSLGYSCFKVWCTSCKGKPPGSKDVTKRVLEKDLTCLVNRVTGNSVCTCCGRKETWSSLQKSIIDFAELGKQDVPPIASDLKVKSGVPVDCAEWKTSCAFERSDVMTQKAISSPLQLQNLTRPTLKAYHVHTSRTEASNHHGVTNIEDCLLLPYYDITKSRIDGLKILPASSLSHVFVGDQASTVFGWHLVSPEQKEVVLASSEVDALAVYEATGTPALALSTGCTHLPPEALPVFEQFDKVVLWFRNDAYSRQQVYHFAKKLGLPRCQFVRLDKSCDPNGALDALNKNGLKDDVLRIVKNARSLGHERILTFSQLRDDLFSELENAEKIAGVKFSRFPALNDILKGHRRGEMTIFTGPTGSGKTTFLSEISLDLCLRGVSTLWGSFEIKNVRLAKIMLSQLSGLNMEKHLGEYQYWADQFENLPMYFMSYYGAQDLQAVIKTIRHAVYAYDIEHVIIDNLQFMLAAFNNRDDRFTAMNAAISAFRKCAYDHNIHITIVIHPRKENAGSDLQTASIYGTAKASQEADNILILQTSPQNPFVGEDEKSLQVVKNRFDGNLGTVPLSFNNSSLCMSGFHRNVETRLEVLPKLRNKKGSRFLQELFASGGSAGRISSPRNRTADLSYVLSRLRAQEDLGSPIADDDDKDPNA